MSESAQHQQLVKMIIDDVVKEVGTTHTALIATDAVDGFALPPLTAEGYRPDVFYLYTNRMIIGEAKIGNDIDRMHSRSQYESYIKKCSLFQGNATFVLAIPWMEHATAHNIIRKIKTKYPGSYTVKILDGIGGAI